MDIVFTRAGQTAAHVDQPHVGTMLHRACKLHGPSVRDLIVFLIRRGFDPNAARGGDGARPLHVAGCVESSGVE